MAIIDVVKWDATDEEYAWKFPSDELSTWSQLIVSESQSAVLLRGGQMLGPFKPGRYTLSTENIPILKEFLKLPFGGRTPFTAEVWFVNKTTPLDVKWGTTDPIQVQDPKYNVMLPVRAFGQYGVQIVHTKKFLTKLVGTLPGFDREKLASYFRGVMLTRAKNAIAECIIKDKISILEISAHLNEISGDLAKQLAAELEGFGLQIVQFNVNSINTPEDDPAVIRLKDALAKKAEMDIVGFSYQQERSFDAVETAAGNPGSGQAGLMGAGMGLGMGVGLGGAMGGAMSQMGGQIQTEAQGVPCPKCKAQNPAHAKFCPSCGQNLAGGAFAEESIVCDKCGTEANKGSKFCPSCGDPFHCCEKCGTDNPQGNLKCGKCGGPMPQDCPHCGAKVPGAPKFCPGCGKALQKHCAKCGAAWPSGAKFCPECGASESQ